jgi:hypothetical protein
LFTGCCFAAAWHWERLAKQQPVNKAVQARWESAKLKWQEHREKAIPALPEADHFQKSKDAEAKSDWKRADFYIREHLRANPDDEAGKRRLTHIDGSIERNLAYRPPGNDFPRATASYTSPYDNVNRANDGLVNYGFAAKQRWTTYQSPNATDWVQIEFEKETKFGRVDLGIYSEGAGGGVPTPKSFSVEYWNGSEWAEVPKQEKRPEMPTANQWNEIHFPKITAAKVRVIFTPERGKGSGITEIAIWP